MVGQIWRVFNRESCTPLNPKLISCAALHRSHLPQTRVLATEGLFGNRLTCFLKRSFQNSLQMNLITSRSEPKRGLLMV